MGVRSFVWNFSGKPTITALLQLAGGGRAACMRALDKDAGPGRGQKFSLPHTRTRDTDGRTTPPNKLGSLAVYITEL